MREGGRDGGRREEGVEGIRVYSLYGEREDN